MLEVVCCLVFGVAWWMGLALSVALCMGRVLRLNAPAPAAPAIAAPSAADSAADGGDIASAATVPGPRLVAATVTGPTRRRRLGTLSTDGERVPLYETDQVTRCRSMRGLVILPGLGSRSSGQGDRLTDLSRLRVTWVIVPRHWMN